VNARQWAAGDVLAVRAADPGAPTGDPPPAVQPARVGSGATVLIDRAR